MTKVEGDVTLRFAAGEERFVPMGQTEPEAVGAGEYCYFDGSGEVLCRLEFRQAEKTKMTEETTSGFFLVQGNPNTPRSLVERTLERMIELVQKFCGGRLLDRGVIGK